MTIRAGTARVRRWKAITSDAAATAALGEVVGETAPDGAVILLEGPLGAGKTTFAQGVARGCGVEEPVTSPTYNLILHYRGWRSFTHVDLFRLTDKTDLTTLDLEEIAASEGVTCVEWPALVREAVTEPFAEVVILGAPHTGAATRRFAGRLVGAGWEGVASALGGLGAEVH